MTSAELPPIPEPIGFASELIKARTEKGLTQSALSKQSGLSLSAIKAYEAGRNMPGARELRELCQALKVSPNMLLFGTDNPFIMETVPENEHVQSARMLALMPLLAKNESASVLTLIHALAVARYGEETVRQALLKMDLMVGMTRELMTQAQVTNTTGTIPDPKSFGTNIEAFMDRQGHIPPTEKDTKKTD